MRGGRFMPRNERGGVALAALGYLILIGVVWAGFLGAWTQVREGKSPMLPAVFLAGLGALILLAVLLRRIPRLGVARAPISIVAAVATGAGAWMYASGAPVARPDQAILTAMASACRGDPVPSAGAYLPEGNPPFHVVVLDAAGDLHAWSGKPPMSWKPASIEDTELVACLEGEARERVLEVCDYSGGSDITRYRKLMDLALVAPRTGKTVWSTTLTGDPRACQVTESKDTDELVGELTFDDVQFALGPYLGSAELPAYDVTVDIEVKGTGTVRRVDGPFRCRGPLTCQAELGANAPVTLRARAAVGWRFTGWDGACTGTDLCTFEPAEGDRVVATFVRR